MVSGLDAEWRPEWSALPGERLELGEGPRVVDGRVVLVDILRGRLLRLPETLDGPPEQLLDLGEPLGAVAPLAGGGWLAAAGTGVAVLPAGGGAPRWLARPEDGASPARRMNDGVADPGGRFWAGSMGYDSEPDVGSVYRTDPDGSVHRVLDGFTVPNGPAFSADGATMYLADSERGLIRSYPVDPATGALGEGREFARVDTGNPDGMTVDEEGCLWSAVWGGAELRRYTPDGELERVVPVPARQPTCPCLVGGRLLVTSARVGLDAPGEWDGAVLSTPIPLAARGPADRAMLAGAD
jgi:sugar lactone lactonase YvrE